MNRARKPLGSIRRQSTSFARELPSMFGDEGLLHFASLAMTPPPRPSVRRANSFQSSNLVDLVACRGELLRPIVALLRNGISVRIAPRAELQRSPTKSSCINWGASLSRSASTPFLLGGESEHAASPFNSN